MHFILIWFLILILLAAFINWLYIVFKDIFTRKRTVEVKSWKIVYEEIWDKWYYNLIKFVLVIWIIWIIISILDYYL